MTTTLGVKQLLTCTACGQVFYRDYVPTDQALLRPLATHPNQVREDRDCRGSGSIGTPLGIGYPSKEAKAG